MNPIPKFDCKNCKHDESDICADCLVTDEGIPTRFEAKDGEIDLNWCFTYCPMNSVPYFRETPTYQEDCYYFSEEQDMNAHIPCCGRIHGIEGYEPKNCNKDCPYYISRSKARELIDKYVEEKN